MHGVTMKIMELVLPGSVNGESCDIIYLLDVVTINSLVQNHARKAGSFLIFQEISRIYGTRMFITAFTTAYLLFFS
jgi:hypothetical protein